MATVAQMTAIALKIPREYPVNVTRIIALSSPVMIMYLNAKRMMFFKNSTSELIDRYFPHI